MQAGELPKFLQDLIKSCPAHGQGVHKWMFCLSRQLHAHFPVNQIFDIIREATANCGRPVPEREIRAAIADSVASAWQPHEQDHLYRPAPKWPVINEAKRQCILHEGYRLVDLQEMSPYRFEDDQSHTEEIIDILFPGNPLLCVGLSSSVFWTLERQEFRGQLSDKQLIVPSPMSKTIGLTKDGHESPHSLDNTGPRRFLICEFDSGSTDEHAAILMHLSRFSPLICAVHSGSKSLHGWFFWSGREEEQCLRFFRYAVSLGADPATWTRSQFVRMPDGTRDNGRRQIVYFLNDLAGLEDPS